MAVENASGKLLGIVGKTKATEDLTSVAKSAYVVSEGVLS
jgi:hypothetical protein